MTAIRKNSNALGNGMSVEFADFVWTWANWTLLVALIVGVIATYGIIASGNVKERTFKQDIAESRRILATAEMEIAKANERIAEANERAAEANLALEKLKAPRTLSLAQREGLIEKLKPFAGQEYTAMVASGVHDAWPLWILLDNTLTTSGWKRVKPFGLAIGNPPAGVPIAPGIGVTIFFAPSQKVEIGPAAAALSVELMSAGIASSLLPSEKLENRPDVLEIMIGMKPQ